jgi:lysozyme
MPPSGEGWLTLADRIIRQFEGCRLLAYPDPASGGDPWTIGWGSTGHEIKRGVVWTQAQCDARLLHDLLTVYGPAVDKLLIHDTPDREKAALVSFAYNLGATALGRSTLLRVHNDGNKRAAADQFLKWTFAGGKQLRGLVRRREAERACYLGIPKP